MSYSIAVLFKPMNRVTTASSPKTLLDLAREAGVSVRADCGGVGVCGKCVVKVLSVDGKVSSPTQKELELLGQGRVAEGFRLACQTLVFEGSVEVFIPSESLVQRYRSADVGLEKPVPLNPSTVSLWIRVPAPSLGDVRPDLDRVVDELKSRGIYVDPQLTPLDIVRVLPRICRDSGWSLDVVVREGVILDVRPHENGFRLLGAAVDIGTSRIVLHLVDLGSGETLAVESMPNPQAVYGADIISRLTYASKSDENLRKLSKIAVNAVNSLIDRACKRLGIPKDWVYEIVAVGNTVMHHLFAGIDVKYLGLAPYTPALGSPLTLRARDLGLDVNSNAVVYLPPVIAGFVGSDALADAVALDVDECREPCMLIDIGTNTEIVLNTGKKIFTGSTPAGPAFEGATMTFGMRASEGAIDQVFIYFDRDAGDYNVRYSVVGNTKPAGICGSGYIDVVANLYRLGLINRRGKFLRTVKSSRLVFEGVAGFIVAKAGETAIGRDIVVNEKDIDSLMLAKAAVASGISMLLRVAGLNADDIAKVYVAGSFGSYINIENAIAIGLLPRIPIDRYVFAGNASVVGAKAMLKSRAMKEKALRLSRSIEYVELAAHPEYKKVFLESLPLPPLPQEYSNHEDS